MCTANGFCVPENGYFDYQDIPCDSEERACGEGTVCVDQAWCNLTCDEAGGCPEGQSCVNAGDSDICIHEGTGSKDCTNDEAACGDMEMCTPVYSECRVACDEDNPCENGLECDLQQGFCFNPSGEPVDVQPCDDGGTCADAGQTCFVWSQCMRQCVGDEDCLVDEACNPETFLCEWNGQGSECGEGQYACWNAEGTNYYCESDGVECQHDGGGIDFGNYRDCSMYLSLIHI